MGLGQSLVKLGWLVGTNGAATYIVANTPCWEWIRKQAPFCWPGGDGSLAVVMLLGVISGTIAWFGKSPPRLLCFVILWTVLGLAFMFVYDPVCLHRFTVRAPHPNAHRELVGFGLYGWSLTPESVESIRTHNSNKNNRPIRTPAEFVHARAAWGKPDVISGILWKPWAVDAAGATLVALYGFSAFFWAFAVGQLCRFLATPLGLELFPNAPAPAQEQPSA